MWRGKTNILDARKKILESSSDLEEMLGHASVSVSISSHTSIAVKAEIPVTTEAYLQARWNITSTTCFFFRIARTDHAGDIEPLRR